jgi:hypothetical protein
MQRDQNLFLHPTGRVPQIIRKTDICWLFFVASRLIYSYEEIFSFSSDLEMNGMRIWVDNEAVFA